MAALAGFLWWLTRPPQPGGGRFRSGGRPGHTLVTYPDTPAGSSGILPDWLPDDYRRPERPRIAIVIDDFGPPGTARMAPEFFELPFDFTISIIPGNLKSVAIGKAAEAAGQEVFIHLPMEPGRPVAMDERDMVLASTDSATLHSILDRASAEIPQAVGLNNHMGSRATRDAELMRLLAGELKRRKLMFVDSRTSLISRGYGAMLAAGVPALERDVFLDNVRDSSYIAGQLSELVGLARRRGWAVGICHAYRVTLETLAREIPPIAESGVDFVSAGELIEVIADIQSGVVTPPEL